jgi:hypothetical protein
MNPGPALGDHGQSGDAATAQGADRGRGGGRRDLLHADGGCGRAAPRVHRRERAEGRQPRRVIRRRRARLGLLRIRPSRPHLATRPRASCPRRSRLAASHRLAACLRHRRSPTPRVHRGERAEGRQPRRVTGCVGRDSDCCGFGRPGLISQPGLGPPARGVRASRPATGWPRAFGTGAHPPREFIEENALKVANPDIWRRRALLEWHGPWIQAA